MTTTMRGGSPKDKINYLLAEREGRLNEAGFRNALDTATAELVRAQCRGDKDAVGRASAVLKDLTRAHGLPLAKMRGEAPFAALLLESLPDVWPKIKEIDGALAELRKAESSRLRRP